MLKCSACEQTFYGERKVAIMKMTKIVILIVMIALALFLILPNLSWAVR